MAFITALMGEGGFLLAESPVQIGTIYAATRLYIKSVKNLLSNKSLQLLNFSRLLLLLTLISNFLLQLQDWDTNSIPPTIHCP